MRIQEIDHGLDLARPTEGYVRTPGLHMSEIYNSLYSKLDPKRYGNKTGGPDSLKMEVGTAFEEVLEEAISRRLLGDRPGEFRTKEGIIYTPDHFLYNGITRLSEFKVTWMSNRYGILDPRFDKWFTQMKVYGHHLDMPQQRLYALFVNGDYTIHQPQLRAWDIEWTRKEMSEEWNMLLRHARREGMLPHAE